MGWKGEVNPPGKDGWYQSGVSRSEKGYGRNEGRVRGLCSRVEETRKGEGYETNGRGVKGDSTHGYVVYGEYVRVFLSPSEEEMGYPELERGQPDTGQSTNRESMVSKDGLPLRDFREVHESQRLEVKRERRVIIFEASTGRVVRRERSQRADVRASRGRKRERGVYRRGRAKMERSHREKVRGGKRVLSETASPDEAQKEYLLAYVAQKEEKRKRSAGVVCTEAMATVVARSGKRRMEGRRVKRRVRKREGAGREHRKARRSVEARRKAHGRKSRYGRSYGYGGFSTRQRSPDQDGSATFSSAAQRLGGYYGYRVTVTGPLNGSRRTKRWEKGMGTVPSSSKASRRGTAEGVAKTSVGTRGVQVTYCYGLG
jgi:hypothetical protein